ncbi:MAG: DEAD/DEAH box helicase [Propionibacteriaceae bacterium]|jgi:ATP-dependent Lhr-like helicase|nr:DEAD/DEAH box helicase [Propionibacteriaceae bacterium]
MTPIDSLELFSPATREWFREEFGSPTQVQAEAWEQIEKGNHALVIAPTGSGKTLAAFLFSINALMKDHDLHEGVRILYISPMKALGVDVEKNLQVPLSGIAQKARDLGEVSAEVRIGVRSGDTSANDRRALVTHPPEILITTPESLFLMLSSAASRILTKVETVIIDEVHYLAGNKRGAHLGVSLERLEALNQRGGFQRVGLSATVRPPELVADYLGGRGRQVTIITPPATKTWQLDVRIPVEDLSQLSVPVKASRLPSGVTRKPSAVKDSSPPGGRDMRTSTPSIWPHVERQIFDLIMTHRSTICFCNSRAVAERLTNHLNALYHEETENPEGMIARTHHGSISKSLRVEIENDLKAGLLPCVVATNSLELGIDMGAVDLVIQVGAPPSVASGLQRIGRGGHQVDAVSHGVLFPLSRSDLLATAVVVDQMAAGEIEAIHRIVNPLDILAQHLVSMCLEGPQKPEELLEQVRRADCFADLPSQAFFDVVDMLTGKYPSDDFIELRPRLTWDRLAGILTARPGARRLVTTSGGTIPDRGLFSVFIEGSDTEGSGKRVVSRRVGELDEEMVYESRVGDIFTLGASAWRIQEINPNNVIVTPVPGQAGRMPFWIADDRSRSAEVGRAIQKFVAELGASEGIEPHSFSTQSQDHSTSATLDEWAQANLRTYIRDQKNMTSVLPDNATILVERHRDEMGAWRICIHSQLGKTVLQPWAMIIQQRIRTALGHERAQNLRVFVTDDGLTLRLGEVEDPHVAHLLFVDPNDIDEIIAEETQRSSLFAAHFRQCAARALLLPKRDPGKRAPLWQQRLRASHLLGVAASYPNFPIIVEALRECMDDVYDLDSLTTLMSDVAARRIKVVEVETPKPSPFASSLLFGYVGDFMYDMDQPLAERITAASLVDPALLASLLGHGQSTWLDEEVLAQVEASLQRLTHPATTMEALWDLVRELGPLTLEEIALRSSEDSVTWMKELLDSGRFTQMKLGAHEFVMVSEDLPILEGLPSEDCVTRLVRRWVRSHSVATPAVIAKRFGLSIEQVSSILDTLVTDGMVLTGKYTPTDSPQYTTQEVLDRVQRRVLAGLRASIKPVTPNRFASFLTRWQEMDSPSQGIDGLLSAVEQLAGYPIPASMLESVVLPGRVSDYEPSMLDEVMASSEVTWSGHGRIGDTDGWICLWPGDMEPVIPGLDEDLSKNAQDLLTRLIGGGAWTIDSLASPNMAPAEVISAIWDLVWAGLVTSDTLVPVRTLTKTGGVLRRPHVPRTRRVRPRPVLTSAAYPGRWMAITREEISETARLVQAAGIELGRYGILTKGSILTEAMTSRYFDVYKVLAAMEGQGTARRGYFIEGLGPAQFALPGAVDRLREDKTSPMVLVAACDPVNPWGASLAWPQSQGHRPTRKAGAIVVLNDGLPVIYVERGAHTLVSFNEDMDVAGAALTLLGEWIDKRRLEEVTLTRINGNPAFETRQWIPSLEKAGFVMTPSGWRRRQGV